jgi:hypothetical protein
MGKGGTTAISSEEYPARGAFRPAAGPPIPKTMRERGLASRAGCFLA